MFSQLPTAAVRDRGRTRPDPLEFIVIDDGGSTTLDKVVTPFRTSIGATLVRRMNGGPGQLENTGAAHARTSLLVFIDDDCTVDREALVVLARSLREHP